MRRTVAVVAAVVLALLGIVAGGSTPASASSPDVPGQFIAKIYTEGLGRLPTQQEWSAAVEEFSSDGCSPQTLADIGTRVYASADYARLGHDNTSRLVTLYRGVWNSEPDPAEMADWQSALDHGESWSTVVARFFVSEQFISLVPRICAGETDSSKTSYAVSGQPAVELDSDSAGFSGTADALQELLNDSPPGSTVMLAERALVPLTKPLTVPDGVTLTTAGDPDTRHYPDMGRLVRSGEFDAPMIELKSGAKLTGVWVDGNRNSPGNSAPGRHSVRVLGGDSTAVVGNKISNTAGASSIQVLGQGAGHACSDVTVAENVITAYSNDHYLTRQTADGRTTGTWSDGISVNCADTTVRKNQIVDTGGVAIALYPGTAEPRKDVPQRSRIADNTIVSAGVSMYAGIVADPQYFVPGRGDQRDYRFDGTKISKNTLWTAPNTHFVIGISAGTRPWYAGSAMIGPNRGSGLSISDNTTGELTARVRTGIAVSGMSDVELGDNPADWKHDDVPGKPGNACPATDVAVSDDAGTAADLQTEAGYTDVTLDGCMGEP
jgi:hypothetical protein